MEVKTVIKSPETGSPFCKEFITNGVHDDVASASDPGSPTPQYIQDEVLMHAPSSASSDR